MPSSGSRPSPRKLRARHLGHVIVDTTVDRPWSQYFCCMSAGNREYVRKISGRDEAGLAGDPQGGRSLRPASRRGWRRASSIGGFTPARYEYEQQALSDMPYDKWREYNAEDTVRFYALRLHEAGMIKSSPQKIIADSTDWRFLDELKRELKA